MTPRDRQRRRLRRRHQFRPAPEGLEPRIALSGAMVGVNLDYNYDDNNDPIWTDLHNLTTGWTAASGSTLSLTADGYPLVNASTAFVATNYPNGNYEFSYTGDGTVSFSGGGALVGPVSVSNGVTSGTVAVNTANGYIQMQLTDVNASDPMDNFHLMMPGYGNGTTPEPMYTPAFLQALEPFSDIRFMNWGQTNNSTLSNWADRVPPTAFVTDGSAGVPYEDMIGLCNEAQKDMWINIPAEATPQFVQSLAQLIDSDLDSNLNVYVEYGNEDWNSGFAAYSQIASLATANPVLDQALGTYQLVAQQTAYTLVSDGQIFDQVFGTAEASRVRPILGGQASWDQFQTDELAFIQQEFGAPSQYVYALAVAPYLELDSGQNVAGMSLDTLFADLDEDLSQDANVWITTNVALANQYGLPLTAYEGGQSLVPGSATAANYNLFQEAQTDPRMYQLYAAMMQDWEADGGGLFNAYQLTGYGSQYGFWGMLPTVLSTGSPKYDALVASMYAPGDTNTDGSVTYADFQTLEANYGTDDADWAQGDFTGSGWVDWTDLDLLRQNITPSGFTATQFATQALFGETATVDTPTALEYDGYASTPAGTLPMSSTSGTVEVNETSSGQPVVLGGAAYALGLGFAGNSSTTIALNGAYSEFDTTLGVDSSGSAASSVIFELYNGTQLLYQSPVMTSSSTPLPVAVNVAGVQNLTLTVAAAPGSTVANDHGVWGDARLLSTANFGTTSPYTLTWQVSQNGQVISTQVGDSFVLPVLSGAYTLSVTATDAQGDSGTASTSVSLVANNPSAIWTAIDASTKGSWYGTYGEQGDVIAGRASGLPPNSVNTVSVTGASLVTWATNTAAAGSLVNAMASGPDAAAWSGSSFTINVNLNDGQSHDVELYALDYNDAGLSEQVQVIDAATGAILGTEVVSAFSAGVYLQWVVSGSVQFKVTSLSGANAVVSGVFIDPPTPPPTLVQENTTVQGNWIGAFGSQGYDIEGDPASLPSDATVSISGAATYTWASSTTNANTLQNPGGSGRAATTWYSTGSSFTINVDFSDADEHDLAIYAVDWDYGSRSEEIQLINPVTGAVMNTQTISSFHNGVYLQWEVSGDVEIKVTCLGGSNAVISGLFFDPASNTLTSGSLVKTDTTTQGDWIGAYGSQGYDIEGDPASLPSDATVSISGAATYTWASSTTNANTLQNPGGSGRAATTWYSIGSSFTINVDFSDTDEHDLAIYAVDWDYGSRSEEIQLINPVTGAVMNTQTISSFHNGVYLQWEVSGDVEIKVTCLAGFNAVISGLFFDPASNALTPGSLVKTDTTTQGNWIGPYGSQGYDIEGDPASLPSDATVSISGATVYTWTSSTTSARALQNPGGSGRAATTWYSSGTFTINVDFSDTDEHDLAIYAVDWDSDSRVEQIQLINAATGAVLNTQTISLFSQGVYLQWEVSGDVEIKVTCLAGANAVISGLFFDPPTS